MKQSCRRTGKIGLTYGDERRGGKIDARSGASINTLAASRAGQRGEIEMWTYATCSSTTETACLVLVLMLAAHGRGGV